MGRQDADYQIERSFGEYNKYLPSILSTINNNITPQAAANLAAAKSVAGEYNKLAAAQQKSEAESAYDLLRGVGGKQLRSLQGMKNELNPTYNALAASGKKMEDLIGSYNLSGLSGGERAAAERGVNYANLVSGNAGSNSATNTVSNALQFSDRYNQKRRDLGNLLSGSASLFGAGQSNTVNPNDMFGRQSNAFGQYGGIGNNTQQSGMSLFGDILNSNTSAANTAAAKGQGFQRLGSSGGILGILG